MVTAVEFIVKGTTTMLVVINFLGSSSKQVLHLQKDFGQIALGHTFIDYNFIINPPPAESVGSAQCSVRY